jgi:N-dimethylarginine dimethylaminohydrolase
MDLYLMSPPHPEWRLVGRSNFRSKDAPEVDAAKARLEWLALAEAIEALGGTVAVLPPERDLTGMPFAAEAGHALPPREPGGRRRFLLPRMKHDHRKPERELWRPFVERLGFETIELGAGTWEGQGDVATFGDGTFGGVTFLFYGGRTDREGALAAREHFDGETFLVEVEAPAFHGNMAVLPLDGARTAFVCADAVEENSLALVEAKIGRDRTHLVSEAEIQLYATNALPVGDTLLAPSIMPARTQKLAERDGMKVKLLEMKELCEKAGGASRCLVCRVPALPDDLVVPEEHRLATTRALIRERG